LRAWIAAGRRGRAPAFDPTVHPQRHAVECEINRHTQHRGFATRDDEVAVRYTTTVQITSIDIWLRDSSNNPRRAGKSEPSTAEDRLSAELLFYTLTWQPDGHREQPGARLGPTPVGLGARRLTAWVRDRQDVWNRKGVARTMGAGARPTRPEYSTAYAPA